MSNKNLKQKIKKAYCFSQSSLGSSGAVCNRHIFKSLAYLIFMSVAVAVILSSSVKAEEKVRYSDLEKESIDQESQQILKEYYGSAIGAVGNVSSFNTISAKGSIAIINLTINGKDRRILTKLNKGILFGGYDSALGTANNLTVLGNLAVNGLAYYRIDTDFGERKLFEVASTLPAFTDEGISRLFNGTANVSINPVFRSAVDDYRAYLSPEGRTKGIYVAEKTNDYFIVKSFNAKSNVKFSWMLSGNRKYYKALIEAKEYEIKATIDYESKASKVNISNYNPALTNQSSDAVLIITGNIVAIGNLSNSADKNVYTMDTVDEYRVIEDVSLRLGISQEEVRKHVKFEYKEPQNSVDEEGASTPASYIEANGSVIIRLG